MSAGKRPDAAAAATFAAIAAFCGALAYPSFWAMPMLWYQPVEHQWSFGPLRPNLGMDWYGRNLFAALVAVLVAASVSVLAKRRAPLSPTAVGCWALGAVMAACAVVLAYALAELR